MTNIKFENGDEGALHIGDDPTIRIYSWCSDPNGQVKEQVHLYLTLTEDVRIMYRFTGPVALSQFIAALAKHRLDVWPDYQPDKDTPIFFETKDYEFPDSPEPPE